MATSSMVWIRLRSRSAARAARQLTHTKGLINTKLGETGFTPARLEVCTELVNGVKKQITCKLELLWTVMSV